VQDDARVLELTLLTKIERGPTKVGPFLNDTPERRLALHLLTEGLAIASGPKPEGWRMAGHIEETRRAAIAAVIDGGEIELAITHAGAVRRAELEQQLQTGRIKEPMGLIWDGRHFRQDTRIALLDVASERPLVVAYLDLNDVKVFNAKSHATGDDAIRRYLELIADIAADRGDAYRLSGGADEVMILLPGLDLDRGRQTVRTFLNALGRERVEVHSLRAAAGVVEVTSAATVDEIKGRADREQERAKAESRRYDGRPSVLAWPPDGLEVIPPPCEP
jgi:GGDEF domain-containing protein